MRFRWMNIGGWTVGWTNPVRVEKRSPKNWYCINGDCIEAYARTGRRLTADGCCPRCGKSLRRIA